MSNKIVLELITDELNEYDAYEAVSLERAISNDGYIGDILPAIRDFLKTAGFDYISTVKVEMTNPITSEVTEFSSEDVLM